jgi:hypothetical protein|tara:strand:- start:1355 stop:2014 length:660 start_codon:yes stop_codon:yes gene_type:complete
MVLGVLVLGAIKMNYSTLTTNIKNFLEDDSTEFDTSIDQIIDQAEAMIFQRLPNLPCFRATATGNLVVGTASYTISSARIIRNVSITSSSNVIYLNHRVDSYLRDYWPNSSTTGTPIMFSTDDATTSGTKITLAPTPSATLAYSIDYIVPATGLSSSNTTTWIGDNAENVLLSACLYESSAFLKAPETVTLYKAQFDEAVQLMQQEMLRDRTIEYNGGI